MPKYEARKCSESNDERWCIYVDDVCDESLGIFGSQEEAEAEIKRLILRVKVKQSVEPLAKFRTPVPTRNPQYSGTIVAVIEPSEGFDHGVAQDIGRGEYALHTEKAFVGAELQNVSVAIKYWNGAIRIEPTKTKERGGNER